AEKPYPAAFAPTQRRHRPRAFARPSDLHTGSINLSISDATMPTLTPREFATCPFLSGPMSRQAAANSFAAHASRFALASFSFGDSSASPILGLSPFLTLWARM